MLLVFIDFHKFLQFMLPTSLVISFVFLKVSNFMSNMFDQRFNMDFCNSINFCILMLFCLQCALILTVALT